MIEDQELRVVTYAIVNAMAADQGLSVSFEVFDSIFDQLGDEAAWGRAAIEALDRHRAPHPAHHCGSPMSPVSHTQPGEAR